MFIFASKQIKSPSDVMTKGLISNNDKSFSINILDKERYKSLNCPF